jgi:hypothetical protein
VTCLAELTLEQLTERFTGKKGTAALEAWLEDCGVEVFTEQLKEQDMTSLLALARLPHQSVKDLAAVVGMSKFMTEAFAHSCDELRKEVQQLRELIEIKKLQQVVSKKFPGDSDDLKQDAGPVEKKLKTERQEANVKEGAYMAMVAGGDDQDESDDEEIDGRIQQRPRKRPRATQREQAVQYLGRSCSG